MSKIYRSIAFFSLVVFSHVFADKIHVVYHIATLNNWDQIVQEQLETMEASGVVHACDSMTVTVVGQKIDEVFQMLQKCSFYEKIHIIHASHDVRSWEFPAIDKIQEIAQMEPDAKILYLHSKGVSHYKSHAELNVRLWRKYMEYFLVEKWKDCVQALDEADVCGVDVSLAPGGVYLSGNFWWARGKYLSTCRLDRANRWKAEQFIGTGNAPVIKSFHQSANNERFNMNTLRASSFYWSPQGDMYFQDILNLYDWSYFPEYYREH